MEGYWGKGWKGFGEGTDFEVSSSLEEGAAGAMGPVPDCGTMVAGLAAPEAGGLARVDVPGGP